MSLKKRKEDLFFTRFKDYAVTLREMGEKFNEFMEAFPEDLDKNTDMLKAFESECDGKKHTIMEELYNSFVTPLDREDIFSMAEKMDDVADCIEDVSSKFRIFNVHEMTPEAAEMGKLIYEITQNIEIMFNALPDGVKNPDLRNAIIALNNLEDKGDVIYRNALTQLFRSGDMDAVDIIKWKELYELLEISIDSGEELADVVEGIMTKNA